MRTNCERTAARWLFPKSSISSAKLSTSTASKRPWRNSSAVWAVHSAKSVSYSDFVGVPMASMIALPVSMPRARPACRRNHTVRDDTPRDPRPRFNQRQPALRAEHAHGGGEPIGIHTAARHNGYADRPGEGHRRGRVDDVGIAAPADIEVLLLVARGGDGAVRKFQHARR